MSIDQTTRSQLVSLVRERGYERRDEPFTLSSGGTSRDYVDCRHVVASGPVLEAVAKAILEEVQTAWTVVGGPTMGADPMAHAVAMLSGREWFSVRKEPKGYGRGASIEGHRLGEGDLVLAVEDTTSTGRSLLDAVDKINATGAKVVAATVLVDRSPEVRGRVEAKGLAWYPLLTWEDLGIEPI